MFLLQILLAAPLLCFTATMMFSEHYEFSPDSHHPFQVVQVSLVEPAKAPTFYPSRYACL